MTIGTAGSDAPHNRTTIATSGDVPIAVAPAPAQLPSPPVVAPLVVRGEKEFGEGWAALAAGKPVDAAGAFARAESAAHGDALVEDARFWRGVALARAGRAAAARVALEAFVFHHPQSQRRGEANAMIGWLALDAGDPAAALARFRSAESDPVAAVRESARRGLASLRRH